MRKARVGGQALVVKNAALFGRAKFSLIELALIEWRTDAAQVDPVEQCHGTTADVQELGGALNDGPTDPVTMNDL